MFSNAILEKHMRDSERYLPAWVLSDPESMIKCHNKPKIEKKKPKKKRVIHSRKYSLYTLRQTLDDSIIQKLEEADLLSQQIEIHLNGVLSNKIRLKALRKSVLKGLEDKEYEKQNEKLNKKKHRSVENNAERKIQKQTSARKQLFRDRLKWERLNEWKNPPSSRNTYSKEFLTYLGQVKLPGKKQDVNELENLYATFQEFSLQPEEKRKSNKVERKYGESITRVTQNKKSSGEHNNETEENEEAKLERVTTHKMENSSESDYEERQERIKRISKLKYSTLPREKNYLLPENHYAHRERPSIMKVSEKNKKRSVIHPEPSNAAEFSIPLKKKLSLASVFRKKASLNSLTSVKITRHAHRSKPILQSQR